jgi:hypothetical protein
MCFVILCLFTGMWRIPYAYALTAKAAQPVFQAAQEGLSVLPTHRFAVGLAYTLANTHKIADVAIQPGKRPDWCHWIMASAKVSKITRIYQKGMNLPSTRARALAANYNRVVTP